MNTPTARTSLVSSGEHETSWVLPATLTVHPHYSAASALSVNASVLLGGPTSATRRFLVSSLLRGAFDEPLTPCQLPLSHVQRVLTHAPGVFGAAVARWRGQHPTLPDLISSSSVLSVDRAAFGRWAAEHEWGTFIGWIIESFYRWLTNRRLSVERKIYQADIAGEALRYTELLAALDNCDIPEVWNDTLTLLQVRKDPALFVACCSIIRKILTENEGMPYTPENPVRNLRWVADYAEFVLGSQQGGSLLSAHRMTLYVEALIGRDEARGYEFGTPLNRPSDAALITMAALQDNASPRRAFRLRRG